VTFLLFFQNRPVGHIPQSILTQNGLNHVDSRKDVTFAVKCQLFETRPHRPPKLQKSDQFWPGLSKFSLDFTFTIGVSRVNTPYSSSQPNKCVIVNRESGSEKLKYVPKFCTRGAYHVISRMHNDDSARVCVCVRTRFGAEYLQKCQEI